MMGVSSQMKDRENYPFQILQRIVPHHLIVDAKLREYYPDLKFFCHSVYLWLDKPAGWAACLPAVQDKIC